jgi:hypothetical protein
MDGQREAIDMADNEQREDDEGPPAEAAPKRKPYEPPAIVAAEVFETLALSCNKTPHTGSCIVRPPPHS